MATKTMTPAQSDFSPKVLHTGLNIVWGEMTATASAGAGMLWLAKIPHGARIIDGAVGFMTAGGGGGANANFDVQVGTSASAACFMGTASGTALMKFFNATCAAGRWGYKVSRGDTSATRYEMVKASISVSWSGNPVVFWISYIMDEPA